jgi:hypothetical protein
VASTSKATETPKTKMLSQKNHDNGGTGTERFGIALLALQRCSKSGSGGRNDEKAGRFEK